MSNMGYCRFYNTAADLEDCHEHIDDTEDLSEHEVEARLEIIKTCIDIADNYRHEVE